MDDSSFGAAPFDLRYVYLSGSAPAGGPCASCSVGCLVDGDDCANAGPGCNWRGCWQWDQEPPGRYAANLITGAESSGAVPMFTYYVWLGVSGWSEGTD